MRTTRSGAKALPEEVKKVHCHQGRKQEPEVGGRACFSCLRFYCEKHLKLYDKAPQEIPLTGWICYFCSKTCKCSRCRKPEEERAKPKRKPKRKREANKDQDHILEIKKLEEQAHQRDFEIHELREERKVLLGKLERAENEKSELQKALDNGEEDRKKLTKKVLELKGNLRVVCRVRPPMLSSGPSKMKFTKERELIGESITMTMYDRNLTRKEETYKFDKVFLENSSQKEIFDEISDLIQSAVDGCKVCLFSFGQAGSGKTFSMFGKEGEHKGIIPRSLEKIFGDRERLKELGWDYHYKVSMVEVYVKKAFDMLSPTALQREPLSNLTKLNWRNVESEEDFHKVLNLAKERRVVSATSKNPESSRSHLVITLKLNGRNGTKNVEGSLNMIDLAGNERPSESSSDLERDEARAINVSLMNIRMMFKSLCKKEVPVFRDSKLELLLKPYLTTATSKIFMIVNVCSEASSYRESRESLKVSEWVDLSEEHNFVSPKPQSKHHLMSSSKPPHSEMMKRKKPGTFNA